MNEVIQNKSPRERRLALIEEKRASSCTVDSIVLCPVCQRGDVWQEAVNRTEYVYNGETVKDGKEVIAYLLAEVASLLEAQNAEHDISAERR